MIDNLHEAALRDIQDSEDRRFVHAICRSIIGDQHHTYVDEDGVARWDMYCQRCEEPYRRHPKEKCSFDPGSFVGYRPSEINPSTLEPLTDEIERQNYSPTNSRYLPRPKYLKVKW